MKFRFLVRHDFYCILINKLSEIAVLYPSAFCKISKKPSFLFIAFWLTFHQELWNFIGVGIIFEYYCAPFDLAISQTIYFLEPHIQNFILNKVKL